MKGKVKILCVCLLAVLLSDVCTGFWHKRRPFRFRIRFFNWPRKGCDRKPSILRLATTTKPKTLPPRTEEPFVLSNPVETNHSSGLPYCKSIDVKAILSAERRTKRETDVWPFHCGHASIVKLSDKHEFIPPIYECCLRCDFPAFTECVVKRKKENFADWVCPSEGLHCIVGCVNKNKPGLETESSLRPAPRPDKQGVAPDLEEKVPNLGRCEKLDTENGNRCVRKLCIPLSLKP